VQIEAVDTGVSDTSPLLQLADLFAGSVARKFNKDGETMNAKGEFAEFFQMVAGFDFVRDGKARGPPGVCARKACGGWRSPRGVQ
jgi:hypothetical protein